MYIKKLFLKMFYIIVPPAKEIISYFFNAMDMITI